MGIKLHETVEGSIAGMDKDGSGVIERAGRKRILVPNTLPGESVSATVMRRTKQGMQARLERVIEPSPDRVAPHCPYTGTCGGCKWQHAAYARQLSLKHDLILQAFAERNIGLPLGDIVGCPDPFYYRNRMDYVFGANGALGLKEAGRWWSVLDLSTCFLLSPASVEILERTRVWSRGTGLPFWNMKTHEGFFRYLVIREGKNSGQRLVTLVTHEPPDSAAEVLLQALPKALGDLATSVVWGINPRITDVSVAERIIPLKGNPWLEETVNGLRYRIAPNSFFQTNTTMAGVLQNAVKTTCGDVSDKTVLDLYCGAGFLTLALGPAKRLIGIEIDADAIEAAKTNAALNDVQAEFHASKAEVFDWIGIRPDVVVLDPPRAGLHPSVLETLRGALPPSLIYIT
ncbi:23S rRNA (uracil(1939)-C(5))-methyltransferase RlmD [Candidatus Uhrbacteria bacterium]|nr:23S rRNA (uracil(1939)-C(5))-methyltransferase RlmD [Candidatus Uhrbacteria bacterium]